MRKDEARIFDALLHARRFKPVEREPVFVGIDYGHGPDKTFVTEFTRDPDGTIHVHSVSECNGEDCGTQYTGGQDF